MSDTADKHRSSRRAFLGQVGMGALGLAAAGRAWAAGEKPNFVFILVDDLGWSDVGCYGNTFHETPHIDRLASQGMRFTDAYAACPVCSPTRASILSGQYPARVGITDFISGHWRPYAQLRVPRNRTQYLPLEITTLAEALKPSGYTCGAFGKWHLGRRKHFPDRQGFDDMVVAGGGRHFGNSTVPERGYGKDEYLSDKLTEEGERFIEENQDRPFMLYLPHYGVHIPLEAREALIAKYEQKPKNPEAPCHPVYAAMVEHIDQSVGRIMAKLDELKLAERTVLVFFSDNGGLRQRFDKAGDVIVTTNAPLRDEKGSLYEGGIREPLIVRWPGVVEAGSVSRVPVTSVDFYPTFLELAGASPPKAQPLDGESIMPVLTDSGTLKRDAIYWHYPHYHHSTPASAIRAGGWKLIEFFEDGHLELYNLRDDIGEEKNLAEAMPEKAQALRKQLAEWRKSVDAAMPVPNPDHNPSRAHEWGKYAPKKKKRR